MPFVVRDIAMWIEGVDINNHELIEKKMQDILSIIKNNISPLVKSVTLFDKFTKDEKLSVGYRLIYQSDDKTLTDIEVNGEVDIIYDVLKSKGYIIR